MSQVKASGSEPEEIAGRYEVIKKLGAGAFGTVYKVKDKILGRQLAIKTIRLEGLAAAGASLDELVSRFRQEAQVSAQLKHPNIVTIYDIGEADGLSYLAMEFIDGVGLERVIADAGRLPIERAASIASQVADALDFAHKNSVVHRDIKPANIMIEAGDRVKVTDFGIAKVTTSVDHLTVTGSLLGTPSYMSPEQARGSDIDGRSDLFAVGAVFYEMLAGHKAFRGDSITGLIFKIITEEPQPIREIDPSVPEEAAQIIAKALAKTPAARYQTGREMVDDLQTLIQPGYSPTIRQTELGTTPLRMTSDGGATLGRAPTVAAGAAVASTHVETPTRLAPPPPPPPRAKGATTPSAPLTGARPGPPKKSSNAPVFIGLALVLLLLMGSVVGGGLYIWKHRSGTQVASNPTPDGSTLPPVAVPDSQPAATPDTTLAAAPPSTQAVAPPPPSLAPEKPRNLPPVTMAPRVEVPPADTRTPVTQPALPADGDQGQDSGDAGQHLAQAYRGDQGRNGTGSTFGTRGRFNKRPLSPPNLSNEERPVVMAVRHVITAEEGFRTRFGHYGNFKEMKGKTFFMDVPIQPESLDFKGYHFALTIAADGFRILAQPTNPSAGRPFRGDDSGYITVD